MVGNLLRSFLPFKGIQGFLGLIFTNRQKWPNRGQKRQVRREMGLDCFYHFMLGAQAPGTQVETLELTVYRHCGRVYVG